MVDLGNRRRREIEESMEIAGAAAAAERSRRPSLHNFEMPDLQWGKQRLLRCMNVDRNDGVLDKCTDFGAGKGLIEQKEERLRKSRESRDGIEAIREKLMFDLQEAADKMKDAILRGKGLDAAAPGDEDGGVRPWNLRTRRAAACKAPNGRKGDDGGVARGLKGCFSPVSEGKSPRLGGDVTAEGPAGEKRGRSRFSVSLSRREIEEDFRALTGHRPPRRPKKRPRIVQKELDTIFPGLWLTEITADIYKVPDAPETGTR